MVTADQSEASHRPNAAAGGRSSLSNGDGTAIVLIEPRPVTRRCLSRWLQDEAPGLHVIPLGGPSELLKTCRPLSAMQMILFSIGAASVRAPDVLGKIGLLRRHLGRTPLAVMCDREDVDEIIAAVELGVRGYIPTSLEVAEAVAAIQFIAAGGTFVPANVMINLANDRRHDAHHGQSGAGPWQDLTPREAEVLARLCDGKRNKVIARELAITESTVKVFVRRVLRKMQASSRAEVASLMHARMAACGMSHHGRPSVPAAIDLAESDVDRSDRIGRLS